MQKKLIALAVASLASGAAFAQTNVTIYGIADAGYVYSSGDPGKNPGNTFSTPGTNIKGTNTFSGIVSGLLAGSRIGFKGEEALGNGLKAIFTLEYALDIDGNFGLGNSASGLQARQQFVGLSSANLGTVSLGRQYAPGYVASGNNDSFIGALFSPLSFLTAQAGNTITPNSGARWNNAITYTSPNWGGFTGKAIYSFGENSKTSTGFLGDTGTGNGVSTTDNSRYGLGFNFANGPLNLDLVYQVRQQVQAGAGQSGAAVLSNSVANNFPLNEQLYLVGAPNGKDVNEVYVGGSFDFKFVKLMASWQAQNDKNQSNADNQTWSVGAVIPVLSASQIRLTYAQTLWDQGSYNRAAPAAFVGTKLLNGNSDAAGIAWTTSLSKRTTLYTGYVWVNNDRNSIAAGLNVGARDEQNQHFVAGVNHTF